MTMSTMLDGPLAPPSAHFALAKPRGLKPAVKSTEAPAGLCPRGLRDAAPVPADQELPEHYFDHQLQLTVGSDGKPLIDTVPWYMAASSYSNTDGQEDWKSGDYMQDAE
jgi:hypothetical protein